jgi:hypothetical protein
MRRDATCARASLVDAHFAGDISCRGERRLRAHLQACSSCHARYERWLVLAELDPGVPSRADRIAVGLGLPARSPLSSAVQAAWFLAATTGSLSLVLVASHERARDPETAQEAVAAPSAEAEFAVYSVGRDGVPPALLHSEQEIAPHQALGFAYAKAGATKHLAIFGVDGERRVVWYHPPAVDSATTAPLLPITNGELLHELSYAFTETLNEGTLRFFAIFTNRDDLRASEVERAVAMATPELEFHLPGCELRHVRLNVKASMQ